MEIAHASAPRPSSRQKEDTRRERVIASIRVMPTALVPSEEVMPAALVPSEEQNAPLSESGSLPAPGTPQEVLKQAEILGVPWQRILREEIEVESRLRRYLPELDRGFSLPRAAEILSFSLLRSWRVRDRIESLACEARTAASRRALQPLRMVFRRLTGKGERDPEEATRRLWLAYQRVLLLQRVRRVAARSRGDLPERLAHVCSTARCGYDDAVWAVSQEDSPRRGHRLEAAVEKVRSEGFQIPRAETEARALAELRRMLHRRAPRRPPLRALSAPKRVRLPLEAF